MDKREIKTRRYIKQAFYELRKKKPIEKITIKELAAQAEISKATFYLHYHDIYDLSEQLGMDLIQEILHDIQDPNMIIHDSEQFTKELILSFLQHKEEIYTIFSGSQSHLLPDQIYKVISQFIYQLYPEYEQDLSFRLRLTMKTKGIYYAYHDNLECADIDTVVKELSKISSLL